MIAVSLNNHWQKISGLLCVGLLALVSYLLVGLPFLAQAGISSLVIAILLGMVVGNTWYYPKNFSYGIEFSAKRLLRLAIILYGFRISFQQIASLGLDALILDLFIVTFTLLGGYWVGKKWLKLDSDLALLISAGSAICGAAAVLAVEDIIKSEPYKASVAIGTVVIFGTLSMFLYPLLQHMEILHFTTTQFGIFTGASIHEVAQAIVAGSNISVDAGQIAVIVKMLRVLLLVPVLFILAFIKKRYAAQNNGEKIRLTIPWFALGFVLVISFNSLQLLSTDTINILNQFDIILLTMAMGAIGLETKWNKIKKVGLTPLYLAIFLFLWLIASSWIMVKFFS